MNRRSLLALGFALVLFSAGAHSAVAEEKEILRFAQNDKMGGMISLVPNGDFERADPAEVTRPLRWDKPDGLGVQWTDAPADPGGKKRGKAIRIDTTVSEQEMVAQWRKTGITQWNIPEPKKNAVADTYGLSFYSDPMPVKSGQAYRISFDFKGAGATKGMFVGAKLWVRGYGELSGEKRRLYETIVNCRVENDGWTRFSQVFHPTKARPSVTEMRVMLYAYHPAGSYWFDNIRIEPIALEEYEQARSVRD